METSWLDYPQRNFSNFGVMAKKAISVVHNLRVPFHIDHDPFAMFIVSDRHMRSGDTPEVERSIEVRMEVGSIDTKLQINLAIRLDQRSTFIQEYLDRFAHLFRDLVLSVLLANKLPGIELLGKALIGCAMR